MEVTYGALSGPWGLTRSIAYVKYALSSQDEHASTSVQLMGVDYAARISMKPKSKFSDLAAFKPYHDRLKKEYKGDVKRLARAIVFNTDDAYREYALLGGVLFHEYLHFKLAQIDGALRYKDLRKAMSGKSPFANAVQARAALTGEVDTIFKGWRGLITYRPSYNDHAYVWEEEFKYLVRRYEKTL